MIGLDAYNLFLGFNLHFDRKNPYDVLKYNGKLRTKEITFQKSKFRWQFSVLEKFCVDRKDLWRLYYLCFRESGFQRITEKRLILHAQPPQARLDQFKQLKKSIEIELIRNKKVYGLYDFENDKSLYPKIFEMYERGELSLEAILLFDKFQTQFLDVGKSRDIVTWPETVDKLKKAQDILLYIL